MRSAKELEPDILIGEREFQELLSKLSNTLQLRHKAAIADLIVSWASADMQLVRLQIAVQRIELAELTRTSLTANLKDRLKAIRKGFFSYGYSESDPLIRSYDHWIEEYDYFVHPRHTVCHAGLFGFFKDDPNCLLFGKLSKYSTGASVVRLNILEIKQSKLFADTLAIGIGKQCEQFILNKHNLIHNNIG